MQSEKMTDRKHKNPVNPTVHRLLFVLLNFSYCDRPIIIFILLYFDFNTQGQNHGTYLAVKSTEKHTFYKYFGAYEYQDKTSQNRCLS